MLHTKCLVVTGDERQKVARFYQRHAQLPLDILFTANPKQRIVENPKSGRRNNPKKKYFYK